MILVVFNAVSCTGLTQNDRTQFSESDLKWMGPYSGNDTLIFKSSKNTFDTSIVFKKEVFYPEAAQPGHEKLQWGILWYTNKIVDNPNGDRFVTLQKKSPNSGASMHLSFLNSMLYIPDASPAAISNYKKGDVYEFDCYDERSKPYEPMTIYWHEKKGIIKYITHDSIIWERYYPR